jgi:hypothetical protein
MRLASLVIRRKLNRKSSPGGATADFTITISTEQLPTVMASRVARPGVISIDDATPSPIVILLLARDVGGRGHRFFSGRFRGYGTSSSGHLMSRRCELGDKSGSRHGITARPWAIIEY